MEYWHYAVLLLILSLALLVAEVFIPSGGMLLVAALLCLAGSVIFAWNSWWESNPRAWWAYVASVVVLIPASVGAAFYVFPRTPIGRQILLEGPTPDEVAPYASEYERLRQLVGKTGRTLTLMNPGGLALVDGQRMHCESEGMLLEPGEPVRIIAVKGNRLVVRRIEPDEGTDHEEDGWDLGEAPPPELG